MLQTRKLTGRFAMIATAQQIPACVPFGSKSPALILRSTTAEHHRRPPRPLIRLPLRCPRSTGVEPNCGWLQGFIVCVSFLMAEDSPFQVFDSDPGTSLRAFLRSGRPRRQNPHPAKNPTAKTEGVTGGLWSSSVAPYLIAVIRSELSSSSAPPYRTVENTCRHGVC